MSAGRRYLGGVLTILDEILRQEWGSIRRAAEIVSETLAAGGLIHAFGTGHSHVLAEEIFYRAGGPAAVNPILVEELMLHAGAERSTTLERRRGLAAEIAADVPFSQGDVLFVASNSGGNSVCEELAGIAAASGVTVIALVSTRHTAAVDREDAGLLSAASVVVDNHGAAGDASVRIEGVDGTVGATSTVAGAAILNAIVAEAVEILSERGLGVDIFQSSNLPGGDERNRELVARYRDRVRSL